MNRAVTAEDQDRIRVAGRRRQTFGPRSRRSALKWPKVRRRGSQSKDRGGAHEVCWGGVDAPATAGERPALRAYFKHFSINST